MDVKRQGEPTNDHSPNRLRLRSVVERERECRGVVVQGHNLIPRVYAKRVSFASSVVSPREGSLVSRSCASNRTDRRWRHICAPAPSAPPPPSASAPRPARDSAFSVCQFSSDTFMLKNNMKQSQLSHTHFRLSLSHQPQSPCRSVS